MTDEAIEKRFNDVQAAVERMAKEVQDANLDVLIICGDDQNELFSANLQPAMGIYHGKTIRNAAKKELPPDACTRLPRTAASRTVGRRTTRSTMSWPCI